MKKVLCLTVLIALSLLSAVDRVDGMGPADRTAESAKSKEVTFARDIAPILQRSCQECHRNGGVAPMPLVTYNDVRPWARSIRERVVERVMPPFHADGPIGRYAGDRRLTDNEINLISQWVDSGAPPGNRAEMPKPKAWVSKWQAGTPDKTLQMNEPFKVQANQQDDYAFFILDYVFPQDTWVRGVEVRPGNRQAVHHSNVYLVPPEITIKAKGRVEGVFDPTNLGAEFLTAWEPGSTPFIRPQDTGFIVRKGTRIGLQMHYTPSAVPLIDRTMVGIHYADGVIAKQSRVLYGGTKELKIPPGAPNHKVIETRVFDHDAIVRAFTCHMHLRGKSFTVKLTYPDGRTENIFNIPHFDTNWQEVYVLAEPIHVPKGTKAEYIATWDNSDKNRFNPDPKQEILWGDRVIDEMMDGYLYYVQAHENLGIEVRNGIPVTKSSVTDGEGVPKATPSKSSSPKTIRRVAGSKTR